MAHRFFSRAQSRLSLYVSIRLLLFAAVHCLLPLQGHAACPDQNGVLYLPSPEGSQIDMLYEPLQAAWGKNGHKLDLAPVPGRGGSYALRRLLRQTPADCSMAALQLPSFLLLSRTKDRMVAEEDVMPVAIFAYVPHALWVAQDSPFQSLKDLQEFARSPQGPGGPLAIAGVGSFTDQHLATLVFDRALGVQSGYFPLTGSQEAIALVKNKKAHACWGYALPEESMPGMRPLAVSSTTRSTALPQAPTFQEQGFDLVSGSHFGIAMARSTPESVARLTAERVILFVADPALQRRYASIGVSPLSLSYEDMPTFWALRKQSVEDLLKEYSLIPKARQ